MSVREDNIRPFRRQLVDHSGHRLLVARDRVRTENHRIARHDRYLLMHIRRHAGQRRHRFSLAACRDQNSLLRRIILKLIDLDQCLVRYIQIPQFLGHLNDIHHAAPLNHYLAVIFAGRIDDLLHTVHIGRKGRNNDPRVLMFRENMVKSDPDRPLRLCETLTLRIGAVRHQGKHALLPDLRKPLQIYRISEYRSIIYLEISRMHDDTSRGIKRQRRRVLDTVVCLDEFNPELSQVDRLPMLHHFPACCPEQVMLRKLPLDDSHCKLRRIDRKIHLP